MKLNHDKVRELLLYIEENLELGKHLNLNVNNSDDETLYAASKLIEAGYLQGKINQFMDGNSMIFINSISWSGHEFLDNIRSEQGWEKTKTIVKNIGGASISLVSDFSAKVTAELISKQLGL